MLASITVVGSLTAAGAATAGDPVERSTAGANFSLAPYCLDGGFGVLVESNTGVDQTITVDGGSPYNGSPYVLAPGEHYTFSPGATSSGAIEALGSIDVLIESDLGDRAEFGLVEDDTLTANCRIDLRLLSSPNFDGTIEVTPECDGLGVALSGFDSTHVDSVWVRLDLQAENEQVFPPIEFSGSFDQKFAWDGSGFQGDEHRFVVQVFMDGNTYASHIVTEADFPTPLLQNCDPKPAPPAAKCAGRTATIVGTNKGETIRGTNKRDVIVAKGGNDIVRGRGGNDLICLNGGDDKAFGGIGKDKVVGGPGADRLIGEAGKDNLIGNRGRDFFDGGALRDRCVGGPGKDAHRRCEVKISIP